MVLPQNTWNLCFLAIPYLYYKWYLVNLELLWLPKQDFRCLAFSGSVDSYVQFVYSIVCLMSLPKLFRKLANWARQNQTLLILLPPQSILFFTQASPYTCLNQTSRSYFWFSDPFLHIHSSGRPACFTSRVDPKSISLSSLVLLLTIIKITTIFCLDNCNILLIGLLLPHRALTIPLPIVRLFKNINSTIALLCLKSSSSFSLLLE